MESKKAVLRVPVPVVPKMVWQRASVDGSMCEEKIGQHFSEGVRIIAWEKRQAPILVYKLLAGEDDNDRKYELTFEGNEISKAWYDILCLQRTTEVVTPWPAQAPA